MSAATRKRALRHRLPEQEAIAGEAVRELEREHGPETDAEERDARGAMHAQPLRDTCEVLAPVRPPRVSEVTLAVARTVEIEKQHAAAEGRHASRGELDRAARAIELFRERRTQQHAQLRLDAAWRRHLEGEQTSASPIDEERCE
jgi:hypothetical protein